MDQTSSNLVLLVIAGLGTALACGLGAVPLFFAGKLLQAWKAALRGLAAGFMAVAAIEGLIRPALNSGGLGQTAVGLGIGTVFVLAMRWAMHGRDVEVGGLRGAGVRQSALMFAVLFIHSVPEGMAMGAAQASGVQGLNVFVIAAIALQNIPEGTAIAIPMASSGFGKGAQFWGAVLTSIPQPIGAPLVYILVTQIAPLLPISLAFAGGAMLAVVILELAPQALSRKTWRSGLAGAVPGAVAMYGLSIALEV
jgi:zinc transporter, ZIP family